MGSVFRRGERRVTHGSRHRNFRKSKNGTGAHCMHSRRKGVPWRAVHPEDASSAISGADASAGSLPTLVFSNECGSARSPPRDSDISHPLAHAIVGLPPLTDIQLVITEAILSKARPASFDEIFDYVNARWHGLRRRDGTQYTTDCRRAVIANLRQTAGHVSLFKRAPDNPDFWMLATSMEEALENRDRAALSGDGAAGDDEHSPDDSDLDALPPTDMQELIFEAIAAHGGTASLDSIYEHVERNRRRLRNQPRVPDLRRAVQNTLTKKVNTHFRRAHDLPNYWQAISSDSSHRHGRRRHGHHHHAHHHQHHQHQLQHRSPLQALHQLQQQLQQQHQRLQQQQQHHQQQHEQQQEEEEEPQQKQQQQHHQHQQEHNAQQQHQQDSELPLHQLDQQQQQNEQHQQQLQRQLHYQHDQLLSQQLLFDQSQPSHYPVLASAGASSPGDGHLRNVQREWDAHGNDSRMAGAAAYSLPQSAAPLADLPPCDAVAVSAVPHDEAVTPSEALVLDILLAQGGSASLEELCSLLIARCPQVPQNQLVGEIVAVLERLSRPPVPFVHQVALERSGAVWLLTRSTGRWAHPLHAALAPASRFSAAASSPPGTTSSAATDGAANASFSVASPAVASPLTTGATATACAVTAFTSSSSADTDSVIGASPSSVPSSRVSPSTTKSQLSLSSPGASAPTLSTLAPSASSLSSRTLSATEPPSYFSLAGSQATDDMLAVCAADELLTSSSSLSLPPFAAHAPATSSPTLAASALPLSRTSRRPRIVPDAGRKRSARELDEDLTPS